MKSNSLIAFIGGALAGAAVALLFAPDKGENIRKMIKEKAEEGYNASRERIRHEAQKVADKVSEKASDKASGSAAKA